MCKIYENLLYVKKLEYDNCQLLTNIPIIKG